MGPSPTARQSMSWCRPNSEMAGRPPSKLRRRRHVRDPRIRFTVFCEGRNTEPAYLDSLSSNLANLAALEIETIPGPGVPHTLATKAAALVKERRKKRRRSGGNSFEENDQIWAVFDRDSHPKYQEAISICQDNGVGVGRSDPCFELWLVLHEQDFDKPCNRKDVQRKLAELRSEYDASSGKTPDCDDLICRIADAETRAEKQLRRRSDEGSDDGNPSTTVFKLTREIAAAANRARRPE
ncbi:MAG: RloB family protein [Pseudomonadota bacterium]